MRVGSGGVIDSDGRVALVDLATSVPGCITMTIAAALIAAPRRPAAGGAGDEQRPAPLPARTRAG